MGDESIDVLQETEAPPSGDLMADLAAKLSIRRKGISGEKARQDWAEGSGGALARVSALIPPPPPGPGDDAGDDPAAVDPDWS
ncbi:WASH complex subunit 1-like isoform X2 [Amphibalanus amphitrite]|uniref:WASH complex subunit 1-like isoform X2 n=1 Tax=Amphibalanus amphitrite TaxID=1232801 RepID=UPI001C90138B|nr:WASH complex subunit 1-like isoform X2 [Amphibalanus amphitrite]